MITTIEQLKAAMMEAGRFYIEYVNDTGYASFECKPTGLKNREVVEYISLMLCLDKIEQIPLATSESAMIQLYKYTDDE